MKLTRRGFLKLLSVAVSAPTAFVTLREVAAALPEAEPELAPYDHFSGAALYPYRLDVGDYSLGIETVGVEVSHEEMPVATGSGGVAYMPVRRTVSVRAETGDPTGLELRHAFLDFEYHNCELRVVPPERDSPWVVLRFEGLCQQFSVWDHDRLMVCFDLHCRRVLEVRT